MDVCLSQTILGVTTLASVRWHTYIAGTYETHWHAINFRDKGQVWSRRKWPINEENVFVNTLTLLSNTHTRIWAWLMSTLILNEARPSRWLLPPCRVKKFKLLGTRLSEDLKWTEYVNDVTSSCYLTIIPGYNCFAQLQHETSRNFLVTHFKEEMSYVFLFNFFHCRYKIFMLFLQQKNVSFDFYLSL